jgi:hypothetical protein
MHLIWEQIQQEIQGQVVLDFHTAPREETFLDFLLRVKPKFECILWSLGALEHS